MYSCLVYWTELKKLLICSQYQIINTSKLIRKNLLHMNNVIDLQGPWQFRPDKEKQGFNTHYEAMDFEDTILLPTTVSEAGKGTPHDRTDTGHLTDPYEMEGYCWYRKTVSLPMKDLLQWWQGTGMSEKAFFSKYRCSTKVSSPVLPEFRFSLFSAT